MDRLQDFGKARGQAQAEGVAFERANDLEKGGSGTQDPPQSQPSLEDEAMKMPEFYQQSDEITTNNNKIHQLTDELEKLHRQALSTPTTEESSELSAKIDVITDKTTQYSNKNRSLLKAIELENSQLREIAPAGSGHFRMRESKHRALAAAFLKTTQRLQKMQQTYQAKYRAQIERQYKIVKPNATAEELKQIVNDPNAAQANIFASAVKDDAKKTLSQMKDRFQDVKKIEKSILALHQLFLELQTLVVEQGDIINRVDYNVDKTVGYTDEAATDMKLAVQYQKSIWKKKWIMVILAVVGVILVILLLLFLLRPLLYGVRY